jgi:hypothetical protein
MVICMNGFLNFEQSCMNLCRIPSCVMQITDTLISAPPKKLLTISATIFTISAKIFFIYFLLFPANVTTLVTNDNGSTHISVFLLLISVRVFL